MKPHIQNTQPEKLAFRIDEAVSASGLGRSSLYALNKQGRLRMTKVCGRRLILREDLLALLAGGAK